MTVSAVRYQQQQSQQKPKVVSIANCQVQLSNQLCQFEIRAAAIFHLSTSLSTGMHGRETKSQF
jgi:hypothetical protein